MVSLVFIFPDKVFSIFAKDTGLVSIGITPLRIMYVALPIATFSIVVAMYFMGVGKVIPAIIVSLSRQVILLIPLIYILSGLFGIKGLWISFPIADVLSALIAFIWIRKEIREMNKAMVSI